MPSPFKQAQSTSFVSPTDQVQNEPQNNNPSYASCRMTPDVEGKIGTNLRDLLTKNGLSDVKIIGYEVRQCDLCCSVSNLDVVDSTIGTRPASIPFNWYLIEHQGTLIGTDSKWLQMQNAGNAFAGVAFHCYGGTVDQQDLFHNRFPDKVPSMFI